MIVIDSDREDISNYMFDRLNEINIDTKIVRDENKILNAFGNNSKVIAVSNKLSDGETEIIYALRNKDTLAKLINDNLEDKNINVSKYYQRRSENDTSKDYYDIQKDTGNIETIVIRYKEDINYKDYVDAIIKALAIYKGMPYIEENVYIVKKGDNLYSISRMFNTSVEEIKKLNNLTSNLLSIGQRLLIPITKVNNTENSYIVQKGDTLYSISRTFNMSVDELKKLNNLTSNIINIGQVLKLKNNLYTVQKGDTLYSISKKYNTTVDKIKQLNNLSSNLLSIGQQLKISN